MIIDILKTLADENRLNILKLIYQEKELCVCNIEKTLGLSQSNVSKHLNRLKRDNIIIREKKAQWAWYSINDDFINKHQFIKNILTLEMNNITINKGDCDGK